MWSQRQGNSMYKRQSFQQMVVELPYIPTRKKRTSASARHHIHKCWQIIDLHQKDRVIKFLKGNTGENLHERGVGRDFLHRETQTIKEKIKWLHKKLKNCFPQATIKTMKRQDRLGESIHNYINLARDFYSEYIHTSFNNTLNNTEFSFSIRRRTWLK